MSNCHAKPSPVNVDGKNIEEVEIYVYHGEKIERDGALLLEFKRRILLGWENLWDFYSIIRRPKSTIKTTRYLFNECYLPVMTWK